MQTVTTSREEPTRTVIISRTGQTRTAITRIPRDKTAITDIIPVSRPKRAGAKAPLSLQS